MAVVEQLFRIPELSYGGKQFVAPSHGDIDIMLDILANQIRKDGRSYDLLAPISNGALSWGPDMAELLDIHGKLAPVAYGHYRGVVGGKLDGVTHYPDYSVNPVIFRGKKVGLFDKVNDSGETMREAKSKLLIEDGAKSVDGIALIHKPLKDSVYTPDYYAAMTMAWVVFPPEIRKFIIEKGSEMIQDGLSAEHVEQFMIELTRPEGERGRWRIKGFVSEIPEVAAA